MKKLLPILPLLLLVGCGEPRYFKLHQEFDCRDGSLYSTVWYALSVSKDTNISTNEHLELANQLVYSEDGSRILCIEETK